MRTADMKSIDQALGVVVVGEFERIAFRPGDSCGVDADVDAADLASLLGEAFDVVLHSEVSDERGDDGLGVGKDLFRCPLEAVSVGVGE